jgi:hypothetical protein
MKKYVTRNNTGGANSVHHRQRQHQHHHYHYQQQQQQYRGKRHKGVLDFVDTLGTVVTAYEDKDVPTSGEMDQVVLSLQTQADKYNYNHYHHLQQQQQQQQQQQHIEDDDYYDNTDKDEDEEIAVTSKTTRQRTGKQASRLSRHDYDKDNDNNNDDDKGNKRVRYERYDRDLINETITQREKERARERDIQKNSNDYSARSSSSNNNDSGLIHTPQYILNSEKVYTIFDAIIRTYGEYSREVGTAFVDTALKLTNRQIDSLACVKMLQTLFRDSPEVVHLFFDLIQTEPGADIGDHGAVDFTKNLTVDERLMFGQKHDTRHKPQSQKFSSTPYHQQHHHTNPTHQAPPLFHQPPPPILNSQQARERHDVVRFLNEVREVLDSATYQRFQDYMLEVRVIYKDKRYNLLEMKMNQVFTLLGNRNDLKMQLERLFPVNKITHSADMFGYQQEYNPQMQMMGYDQMRMAPGHMHFPGAQYPTELPRPPLGHPLYPSAISAMSAMSAMPSMPSMSSMFPGGMPPMFQGGMLPQATVGMGQQQHQQHGTMLQQPPGSMQHQQHQQHHQQQQHQQQQHQQHHLHHHHQHGNMLQQPPANMGHLSMPGGIGSIDYSEYLNRK